MKNNDAILREHRRPLSGEEILYSALADLLEAGAAAMRNGPVCVPCAYGNCTNPSMKDSPTCRKHEGMA